MISISKKDATWLDKFKITNLKKYESWNDKRRKREVGMKARSMKSESWKGLDAGCWMSGVRCRIWNFTNPIGVGSWQIGKSPYSSALALDPVRERDCFASKMSGFCMGELQLWNEVSSFKLLKSPDQHLIISSSGIISEQIKDRYKLNLINQDSLTSKILGIGR